jgi:hypothetical protein
MPSTSRRLTSSAINIFIFYYFPLPWLREYLLNQRVWIIHKKEAEDEIEENVMKRDDPYEIRQAVMTDKVRMREELMFLIQSCHSSGATPEILYEIMEIVSAIEGHRTLITRYRSEYNVVNSIHFNNAICSKVATANETVSSCWQKVARIPLKEQLEHSCYFEAKKEEYKHFGYACDKDLEVINADVGKKVLREWIENEYKFRVNKQKPTVI